MTMKQTATMSAPTEPIDRFLDHLRRQRRTVDTIDTYSYVLHRAQAEIAGGLVAEDSFACTAELEWWLTRPDDWSASTQQLYTIIIQRFFGWLVEQGYLADDPAAGLDRPHRPRRVPRPATTEQVQHILSTAAEPVRLWSLIAAHAGARAVEISRLHREHITPELVTLWGKGDAERHVPTHPALWAAVRDLPPGPITPYRNKIVSVRAHREYRRIGVLTSIHKLRAWFATELDRAGVRPRVIQELLGHTSLTTTQAYLGVAVDELTAAVGQLPTLAAGGGGAAAG